MSIQKEAVPGWDRPWREWGAPYFGAQKPILTPSHKNACQQQEDADHWCVGSIA